MVPTTDLHDVADVLRPAREHLLRVPLVSRVPLMEGLFGMLFLKRSHVVSSASDTPTSASDTPTSYILTVPLAVGLLRVLTDCLEHIDDEDPRIVPRVARLRRHVKEAMERVQTLIATNVPSARSSSELMGRMLSSPQSLLRLCLKQAEYERCERLITFFDLPHACARDVAIARTLDDMSQAMSSRSWNADDTLTMIDRLGQVVRGDLDVDNLSTRLQVICVRVHYPRLSVNVRTAHLTRNRNPAHTQTDGIRSRHLYLSRHGHLKADSRCHVTLT